MEALVGSHSAEYESKHQSIYSHSLGKGIGPDSGQLSRDNGTTALPA